MKESKNGEIILEQTYIKWEQNIFGGYSSPGFKGDMYYGIICVLLKFVCWSPNPHYLQMWVNLETVSL